MSLLAESESPSVVTLALVGRGYGRGLLHVQVKLPTVPSEKSYTVLVDLSNINFLDVSH